VFKLPLSELLLPYGADGNLLIDWARGPRLAQNLSKASAEYEALVANVAAGTRSSSEWDERLREQLAVAHREMARWGNSNREDQADLARARLRFFEDVARAREEAE
jgi:hypothetical protein